MARRSLVAAVLAVATSGVLAGCFTADGGPIKASPPHGWSTTQRVGATFGDGLEMLRLTGQQDAVIKSVSITGDDGLKLVDARLAGPDRETAVQRFPTWPPVGEYRRWVKPMVPAEGATITPDPAGWELLLGLKVTRPGYLVRDSVRVEYEVGGRTYVRDFGGQLVVCTSPDMEVNGECPFPKDGDG